MRKKLFPRIVAGFLLVNTICSAQIREQFRRDLEANILQAHRSRNTSDTHLVLVAPAIAFDASIDITKPQGRAIVANLLDRVPLPSFSFGDSGRSVPDVYKQILGYKDTPVVTLSHQSMRRLNAAKRVLFRRRCVFEWILNLHRAPRPSRDYTAYRKYRDAYEQADDAYESLAQSTISEDAAMLGELEALRTAAQDAKQRWLGRGHKNKVEEAMDIYDTLTSYDPAVWWNGLQSQFDENAESLNRASRFQSTGTSPPYNQLAGASGWRTSAITGFGSGSLTVSLETKEAAIVRPWLDLLVFSSRAWRWQPSSPNPMPVSDGGDGVSTPLGGTMPMIATSIVIARTVTITGGSSSDQAALGILSGNGLRIIGFMCQLLPQSPNPDPALDWRPPLTSREILTEIPQTRAPVNSMQ